jgi:hypothetical protein
MQQFHKETNGIAAVEQRLNARLAAKDAQLAAKDAQLAEKERQLNAQLESKESKRITAQSRLDALRMALKCESESGGTNNGARPRGTELSANDQACVAQATKGQQLLQLLSANMNQRGNKGGNKGGGGAKKTGAGPEQRIQQLLALETAATNIITRQPDTAASSGTVLSLQDKLAAAFEAQSHEITQLSRALNAAASGLVYAGMATNTVKVHAKSGQGQTAPQTAPQLKDVTDVNQIAASLKSGGALHISLPDGGGFYIRKTVSSTVLQPQQEGQELTVHVLQPSQTSRASRSSNGISNGIINWIDLVWQKTIAIQMYEQRQQVDNQVAIVQNELRRMKEANQMLQANNQQLQAANKLFANKTQVYDAAVKMIEANRVKTKTFHLKDFVDATKALMDAKTKEDRKEDGTTQQAVSSSHQQRMDIMGAETVADWLLLMASKAAICSAFFSPIQNLQKSTILNQVKGQTLHHVNKDANNVSAHWVTGSENKSLQWPESLDVQEKVQMAKTDMSTMSKLCAQLAMDVAASQGQTVVDTRGTAPPPTQKVAPVEYVSFGKEKPNINQGANQGVTQDQWHKIRVTVGENATAADAFVPFFSTLLLQQQASRLENVQRKMERWHTTSLQLAAAIGVVVEEEEQGWQTQIGELLRPFNEQESALPTPQQDTSNGVWKWRGTGQQQQPSTSLSGQLNNVHFRLANQLNDTSGLSELDATRKYRVNYNKALQSFVIYSFTGDDTKTKLFEVPANRAFLNASSVQKMTDFILDVAKASTIYGKMLNRTTTDLKFVKIKTLTLTVTTADAPTNTTKINLTSFKNWVRNTHETSGQLQKCRTDNERLSKELQDAKRVVDQNANAAADADIRAQQALTEMRRAQTQAQQAAIALQEARTQIERDKNTILYMELELHGQRTKIDELSESASRKGDVALIKAQQMMDQARALVATERQSCQAQHESWEKKLYFLASVCTGNLTEDHLQQTTLKTLIDPKCTIQTIFVPNTSNQLVDVSIAFGQNKSTAKIRIPDVTKTLTTFANEFKSLNQQRDVLQKQLSGVLHDVKTYATNLDQIRTQTNDLMILRSEIVKQMSLPVQLGLVIVDYKQDQELLVNQQYWLDSAFKSTPSFIRQLTQKYFDVLRKLSEVLQDYGTDDLIRPTIEEVAIWWRDWKRNAAAKITQTKAYFAQDIVQDNKNAWDANMVPSFPESAQASLKLFGAIPSIAQ